MNLWTFFDILIGPRPWRKERRRLWPRVLGWLVALLPFAALVALWYLCSASGAMDLLPKE